MLLLEKEFLIFEKKELAVHKKKVKILFELRVSRGCEKEEKRVWFASLA
jgi:hypothetical protein